MFMNIRVLHIVYELLPILNGGYLLANGAILFTLVKISRAATK